MEVLTLNSKDGIERVKVWKPEEKDLQPWKNNKNTDNTKLSEWLKTVNADGTHISYDEAKEQVKDLKYIYTCPECKKVKISDIDVLPYSKQKESKLCDSCSDIIKCESQLESDRKEKEKTDREKEKRIIDYRDSVPVRYSGSDIIETDNEKLINADCSIMYGGFGTGKTWAAYSLIKKLYCNLYIDTYKMITEAGLINYLKAGFNNNSFEDRLNTLKEVDLLIVDEMGKSSDTDFNKAQLFEILNYRYDWMKKTVLICNCLEKSELVDILNPAITDRFRECIIEMDGKSKRYSKE